jgi:FkbM family methyltransferase
MTFGRSPNCRHVDVKPSSLRNAVKTLIGRRHAPAEEIAYRRLRAKGFRPAWIIDVGAYEGNWARLARRVFPEVPVLMVEPQQAKHPFLDKVTRELKDIRYVPAFLGRQAGQSVEFFEMETGSSIFPERSNVPRRTVRLETTTLDELARDLPAPIFLKIDVQGAELEVLDGGKSVLGYCSLVQLEVALLPYNEGAPSMLEVLAYMDERGFVPLDLSGFSRPNGVDLAQIDIIFAPRSSSLRTTFFSFNQRPAG